MGGFNAHVGLHADDGYLTGDVQAKDFGNYTATGNVAATLNHDLSQHLIRLNKIRQAVPALRKGQWTDEGCTPAGNGIAFKRAYKDESYALVAINGGATFTDCPAGTYTDLVTGKTYTGTTITVDAPATQGQLRVLVKDWKGGQIGEDGPFIYNETAKSKSEAEKAYDGHEEDGTTWVEPQTNEFGLKFSQAGGTFRTNTITVEASLSGKATSGWFQVEGQEKVELAPGETKSFTIGEGMNFKQTKTVTWYAKNADKEKEGKVSFTKVDPNASITVYVKADKAPTIYAWVPGTPTKELTGAWHGKTMDGPEEIGGVNYWYKTFDGVESFNVILNNGNDKQSSDITGITGDIYLEYDGGSNVKTLDAPVNTAAKVTLSPNGADFEKTITVTATLSDNAKSGWYKIGDQKTAKLKIYSINGVKVAEVNKVSDAEYVLAPGMYICNGKKFVIK